jgi:hypothetical protein
VETDDNHQHLAELLGVYALNAADPLERVEVDGHVATCDECRLELEQHSHVVEMLSYGVDGMPPSTLWSGIEAELDATTGRSNQAGSVVEMAAARPTERSPWPRRFAVAASMVLIGLLSITVAFQALRIDSLESDLAGASEPLQRALAELNDSPGTRVLQLGDPDGAGGLAIVLGADGTGFVTDSDLSPLPANRTYQLWAIVDGTVISAGVLGTDPSIVPFRIDAESLEGLAVTEETHGGVVTSANDPVALWLLDA